MKKIYLLALISIFASITKVQAYDFTAPDVNGNTIYYTILGGDSVEISNNGSGGSYSGDIVVSDVAQNGTETYRVTTIGGNAFSNCTLTSINLPEYIIEIKSGAFSGCKLPSELVFPNVRIIGWRAFYGSNSINKLSLPKLQTASADAIYGSYDLKEVVLSDELESLTGCSRFLGSNITLTDVHLPAKLKNIPEGCFRACWSLKHIQLPEKLESIEANAFLGCIWLQTITIPKKVKYIGDNFICGKSMNWGGAWTDFSHFGGYYVNGLYPGDENSNQLHSIYFEGTTPPEVTSSAFANIIKANVTCYVPEEAVETYKANPLFANAFRKIVGFHLGVSGVEDITKSSATLKWLPDSTVTQYDINVYTGGAHFAQYLVDSNGQIISSQRFAPSIYHHKLDTTTSSTEFFVISLDGLSEGTEYNYTIDGTNSQSAPIYHEEGSFTTMSENEEGFFDVISDDPRKQTQKFIRDGMLFIERNGVIYSPQGIKIQTTNL